MAKIREEKIAAIVARNIRTLRAVRGFTQKQLQERAGWQQQSVVWQLENGKIGVGPQTLAKLADALLVDPGMLFMESLPDSTLEIELLAKMDLKNIGGMLINSLTRTEAENILYFAKIPLYDMQDVPECDNNAPNKYYPLIKNSDNLKQENLVCVRVDKTCKTSIGYSEGDILCLDRGDKSGKYRSFPKGRTDQFVVKLATGVDVYLVEGEGPSYNLINLEDVYEECGELPSDPMPISLLGFPNAIIGRVLWAVKSVAKGLPPCRVLSSPVREEPVKDEGEPLRSPDRMPREE